MAIHLKKINKFVQKEGFNVDIILTPSIQDRIAVTDGSVLALNANILKEDKDIIVALAHELAHIKNNSSEHNEAFKKDWTNLTLKLSKVLKLKWDSDTVEDEIRKIEFLFANLERLSNYSK